MPKSISKAQNKYDADDIIAFVRHEQSRQWHTNLRQRMEEEFTQFYCLEQEPISAIKGSFDQVIDNAPRVFADKLIEELSSGRLLFTIPIYKEQKSEKENVSMTEQSVYGLLNLADDGLTAVPYGAPALSQMAFYTTTTGFIIERFWMYEENEHGEKIVVPDLALWHFSNTFWQVGRKGLKRICHVRYASASELNDQYGQDYTDAGDKGIEVYDHWSEDAEQVVIRGDIVHEVEHNLGYVPARIITAGSMPVINLPDAIGNSGNDLMKYIAPSCWARGKDIWLASSELLSYYKTLVGRGSRRPMKLPYDSTKGGEPIDYDGDKIDQKGANVPVDVGTGQDVLPIYTPEMSKDALTLYGIFKQKGDMASAPEIMYGVLNQDVTAQGTAMLIHAAMTSLKSGKRTIESAMTWLANEMISQYKNGDWDDIRVQGVDHAENQFATKISKDKLVTDRRIEAKLNIETPQDEMENIGKAIELKKSGLVSDETIQDRLLKILDPQSEADKLLMQRVEQFAGISIRRAQGRFIEIGDRLAAAELQQLLLAVRARVMQQIAPPPPAIEQGAGVPGKSIPGAMPGQMMNEAMPSERMADRMRLASETRGRI